MTRTSAPTAKVDEACWRMPRKEWGLSVAVVADKPPLFSAVPEPLPAQDTRPRGRARRRARSAGHGCGLRLADTAAVVVRGSMVVWWLSRSPSAQPPATRLKCGRTSVARYMLIRARQSAGRCGSREQRGGRPQRSATAASMIRTTANGVSGFNGRTTTRSQSLFRLRSTS